MTRLAVAIAGLPGALTDLSGSLVTLTSPKAYPPGQPIVFTLIDAALRLEGKSIGSKRLENGEFELRARLINLRKETREALDRVWSSLQRGPA